MVCRCQYHRTACVSLLQHKENVQEPIVQNIQLWWIKVFFEVANNLWGVDNRLIRSLTRSRPTEPSTVESFEQPWKVERRLLHSLRSKWCPRYYWQLKVRLRLGLWIRQSCWTTFQIQKPSRRMSSKKPIWNRFPED